MVTSGLLISLQAIFDKCQVAVIVFDVNQHNTLRVAKQYYEKVKYRVGNYPTKYILVGNKVRS